MKLALIGHRGVGKSSLLQRIHKYLANQDVACISLDQEVEKMSGKTIEQIFSQEGESKFRELEQLAFSKIEQKNVIVDLGAGFNGSLSKDWKTLWIKRPIDSSRSQFLNRPNLDNKLTMDLSRFEQRERRYRDICNFELELLEHNRTHCPYEEEYFLSLFLGVQKKAIENPWFVTLFENKQNRNHLSELMSCGFELRDDLLSQKSIEGYLADAYKSILSFRNPELKSKTEKLLTADLLWDWPLEWGKSEAPILSLHERKDSLIETLMDLDNIDSIIKLAIPIDDFDELRMLWQWHSEDPEKRVILPSSKSGRWKWFRLLTAQNMKFSYFREGSGSSADQPTLLEVLRFDNENKNWAAILGTPVKHSLTPATHDNFFKEKKANTLHVDLTEQDWDIALPLLNEWGMKWAAVTSPLKQKAFEVVQKNKTSDLESTNSICFNKKWLGTNTDIDGLKILAKNIKDESVVVWGGGGTLGAIKEFLPQAIFYSSRTGQPRDEAIKAGPENIIWAVGLESFAKEGVMPPQEWSPKRVVDLNYTQDSPGISCAYNYGCQYHSGLDMFLEQGRKQQEFWNKYGI